MSHNNSNISSIPPGWEMITLGSRLKIFGGGAFKSEDSNSSGIKWLKISNVDVNSIIWDEESYLPTTLVSANQKYLLKPGDYVMALTRPIISGKLKIARIGKSDVPALINQRVGKILTDERIDNDFAYYLLQKHETIEGLKQGMAGSDPPNLGNTSIYNIICVIPTRKNEQKAIATALSDTDALISSLEKLIAKKRSIKQGIMQQLFIPKNTWQETVLGNVLDRIVGGGTPSRTVKEYWGGKIPWATVKDFSNFDPSQTQEYITGKGLENSASNLIPKRTLIIPTRIGLGKAAIYEVDVSINQDLKALFPSKAIKTLYLYYWFLKNSETIEKLGSGSTVLGISLNELKNLKIHLPTVIEQEASANTLADIDSEIRALESKLSKYRQIKTGMMQTLLTGKIRLI